MREKKERCSHNLRFVRLTYIKEAKIELDKKVVLLLCFFFSLSYVCNLSFCPARIHRLFSAVATTVVWGLVVYCHHVLFRMFLSGFFFFWLVSANFTFDFHVPFKIMIYFCLFAWCSLCQQDLYLTPDALCSFTKFILLENPDSHGFF